jgi:hypothetical protein
VFLASGKKLYFSLLARNPQQLNLSKLEISMSTTASKDRSSLCSFTFADGRRCRTPRRDDHPQLCAYHARKEARELAAEQTGREISSCLSGGYVSACDLSSALGHLFSALAQGQVKPKAAATLAYLGQTLIQSIHLAEQGYINAFGPEDWRKTIRSSFTPSSPTSSSSKPKSPSKPSTPPTEPKPKPAPLAIDPASYVESTVAKMYQNK